MSEVNRGRRKVLRGIVVSDKMNKTRVVVVYRIVEHPKYHKYIKKRKKIYVHDENNESKVGDLVEVMETRPLSKLKRWRLVRIIRKGARFGGNGKGGGKCLGNFQNFLT